MKNVKEMIKISMVINYQHQKELKVSILQYFLMIHTSLFFFSTLAQLKKRILKFFYSECRI